MYLKNLNILLLHQSIFKIEVLSINLAKEISFISTLQQLFETCQVEVEDSSLNLQFVIGNLRFHVL